MNLVFFLSRTIERRGLQSLDLNKRVKIQTKAIHVENLAHLVLPNEEQEYYKCSPWKSWQNLKRPVGPC